MPGLASPRLRDKMLAYSHAPMITDGLKRVWFKPLYLALKQCAALT